MSMRGLLRVVGITAAIAGPSGGDAGAVVVVGTADPALDVPAVQQAVDQGGTVILSGTFDFGTHAGNHIIVPGRAGLAQDVRGESTVFIYQSDVTIVGETDASGNLLTVIRSGMPPFWIGWDGNVSRTPPPGTPNVDFGAEFLPQDVDGRVDYRDTGPAPGYLGPQTRYALAFSQVSATIQHITFDSPWHYGIKATAGRNISYLENVIQDVQWGGLVHLNNFVNATRIAGGTGAGGGFYAPFTYPSISGSVTIEGNRVENVGTEITDTHSGECFGLATAMTNAVVTITENEIRNVGRDAGGMGPNVVGAASILFFDTYGGAPFIGGNTIDNSSRIGIWDLTAVASSPAALIVDNTIDDCPTGIASESLGPAKSGAIIRSNRITQDGSFGSGDVCIRQSNADSYYICLNQFSGDFEEGLRLENCRNDLILWNDAVALATPAKRSTYFLDPTSCGNTIRAHSGTVASRGGCENDVSVGD